MIRPSEWLLPCHRPRKQEPGGSDWVFAVQIGASLHELKKAEYERHRMCKMPTYSRRTALPAGPFGKPLSAWTLRWGYHLALRSQKMRPIKGHSCLIQRKTDNKTCASGWFTPYVAAVVANTLTGQRQPKSQSVLLP